MSHHWKTTALLLLWLGALNAHSFAINPFLQNREQPTTAEFKGTEWNDEYAPKDIPLTAKVVTTQAAKTPWGGIFKISFEDLTSKAEKKRAIQPLYFVVTDDVIALLNEEKMDEAVKRIAALEKPPKFEDSDIYGISHGAKKLSDSRTRTTIKGEKNTCTYLYNHDSGNFMKVVWQKGLGLVEYGQGAGAHQDGFRLKRAPQSKAAR
jgi:hypothetical protein